MESIIRDIEELSIKIKSSDIYRDYLDIKQVIESDAHLQKELDLFKKVQAEYEIKKIQNGNIDFGEEQHISKLYSDLMLNSSAKKFLLAEQSVLQLIKSINDTIINSFEADINMPF